MIRKLTEKELIEMEQERIRFGAVGMNAWVCKCGHIDYRPNVATFSNNLIMHNGPCIECRDAIPATGASQ